MPPAPPVPPAQRDSAALASATPASTAIRPASELAEASRRYAPVVRGCYEREGLRHDPSLAATLEVAVVIAPSGAVQRVTVDTSVVRGLGAAQVMECVRRAAAAWHFSSGAYALEEPAFTYKLTPPDRRRPGG